MDRYRITSMRRYRRRVTIDVPESVVEYYSMHYRSMSAGIVWAIQTYPILYSATLDELRGRYSLAQLKLMLLAMEPQMVQSGHVPSLVGAQLIAGLRNLAVLQPEIPITAETPIAPLIASLEALTPLQRGMLEIWAGSPWVDRRRVTETRVIMHCLTLVDDATRAAILADPDVRGQLSAPPTPPPVTPITMPPASLPPH